jgi:hypothetical protein
MLFAIIGGLIAVPVVHIGGHFSPPAFLPPMLLLGLLCASWMHDLISRRRIHPVSWLSPVVIVGFIVARNLVTTNSRRWHDFVAWWNSI